jgi:hypothetical protein
MVVAASCCGNACHWKGLRSKKKMKRNKAKHKQNTRGNLVQSAFQQTLGDKFIFQQDNYLKHKYTLELLTKMTLNVPELPNYGFDLNRLENLWQDLKIAV